MVIKESRNTIPFDMVRRRFAHKNLCHYFKMSKRILSSTSYVRRKIPWTLIAKQCHNFEFTTFQLLFNIFHIQYNSIVYLLTLGYNSFKIKNI